MTTIAVSRDTLATGDVIGRVHILDWIPDAAAQAAWLERCQSSNGTPADLPTISTDGSGGPPDAGRHLAPEPAPADVSAAPAEMQVAGADFAGARYIETYRGHHLFQLADGRVYLDGLIAVATLDHARATLDELARRAGKTEA